MNKKQKRMALVGGAFAVSALGIGLVLVALNKSIAYFYTPTELAALAPPPKGLIRLGGLVVTGSVVAGSGDDTTIRFRIGDQISETEVSFDGVLPDLFREGQGVIVQGRVRADGSVTASEVLAKHDEKYMPREVAEALKKQGRWQEGGAPDK